MYYCLTQAVKRRLIHELKDSFAAHPIYDKIVPWIQNRYSFDERPQMGIVVKGASANKVGLSSDNYLGRVQSHVMLAYVGAPVYPIEWVREDIPRIAANGGQMPTPPGVYYVEITKVPQHNQDLGEYFIDPLLTVSNEPVLRFADGVEDRAQLQQIPVKGTLRLWENGRFLLNEGTHYTVDYKTGAISLLGSYSTGTVLNADYRYSVESVGPFTYGWNRCDATALPGVVLAFGKRSSIGDKVAVVVYEDRVDVAEAYGGKFQLSFELDVITRDTNQSEEIADLVIMYLWAQKRAALSAEGFEIDEVNMGGEAEEIFDETGDDYFYTANLTVQVQADWEMHIPLPLTVSRVTPTTAATDASASITDTTLATTLMNDVNNGLLFPTMATIAGRNNDFERIR